jgi:type II secretory ATPase GspE/PulE/Tfp pilus assembly ATPase PilB-like protein
MALPVTAQRFSDALRRSELHSNIAEGFDNRMRQHGLVDAFMHLLRDGQPPEVIAKCASEVVDLPVIGVDSKSILERGTGWAFCEDGTMAIVNPFDDKTRARLIGRFNEKILDWAIVEHEKDAVYGSDELAEQNAALENDASNDAVLDRILIQAWQLGVSDVHLRVATDEGRVRYRRDDRLVDTQTLPLDGAYEGVVNRVLARCGHVVGDYNRPASGQFSFSAGGRSVTVRSEQLPTRVDGQSRANITMRLLGAGQDARTLSDLGFPCTPDNDQEQKILSMSRRPNGLILATGPTGSGKSTTLSKMVERMVSNAPDRAYYSIEDPVENEMNSVDQVQVNVAAGLTFEAALRSLLRKDPDVILVGEIRDRTTMNIAVEAGLTGHLLLSTLHSNDAVSTITRMLDMGCDPIRLADSLIGIVAQRVVPKVCPKCAIEMSWREMYSLDHDRLRHVPRDVAAVYTRGRYAYRDLTACPSDDDLVRITGDGCDYCEQRGFKGRCIVTETLVPDSGFRDLVAKESTYRDLKTYAQSKLGFVDLWGHAIARVAAREITLDVADATLEPREPSPVESTEKPYVATLSLLVWSLSSAGGVIEWPKVDLSLFI